MLRLFSRSDFAAREIPSPLGSGQAPRPAGKNAGLRDDAETVTWS